MSQTQQSKIDEYVANLDTVKLYELATICLQQLIDKEDVRFNDVLNQLYWVDDGSKLI